MLDDRVLGGLAPLGPIADAIRRVAKERREAAMEHTGVGPGASRQATGLRRRPRDWYDSGFRGFGPPLGAVSGTALREVPCR